MEPRDDLPMDQRRGDKKCPHGYTKRAACHECRDQDAVRAENLLIEVYEHLVGCSLKLPVELAVRITEWGDEEVGRPDSAGEANAE